MGKVGFAEAPLVGTMGVGARWRHAMKPASWPKLLVPMLLGNGLGLAAGGGTWGGAAFGLAFTLALGTFIVLLNDWADEAVDRLKREMFPAGCSPKTIPDGLLPASSLLRAGLTGGLVALALGFGCADALARPWLGWAALACVATFVAYSLPPVALNYRGGGEALEAIGVGVLLPLTVAYAQAGLPVAGGGAWLVGHGWLALASALASGLSDEQSDRAGGKRTCTTQLGNARTRALIRGCLVAAALSWAVVAGLGVGPVPWVGLLAAGAVLLHAPELRRLSEDAVTNAFAAQGRFKQALHQAGWLATTVLAAGLAGAAWIRP